MTDGTASDENFARTYREIVDHLNRALDALSHAVEELQSLKPESLDAKVTAPQQNSTQEGIARKLRSGETRMLKVLARQAPLKLTRRQLATLARLKGNSGTYSNYLANLRDQGLISASASSVAITEQGRRLVGDDASARRPMTAKEAIEQWRAALRGGARRMLDALLEARPEGLRRDELADKANLKRTSGTFSNYLAQLRNNGLIEVVNGRIRLSGTFDLSP